MRWIRDAMALVTTTLLALPSALVAQSCDALLQHGLRNVTSVVTSDVYSRVDYASDCGSDFASRSDQMIASLSVRVGLNGGGTSFNRTQAEQALKEWCRINSSKLHTDAQAVSESSTLADYAVNAWLQCVALERQDVRIQPAITPDAQTVTFSVQYVGSGRVGPQFLGAVADGYTLQAVIAPTSVREKALQNVPFTLPKTTAILFRFVRNPPRDTIFGGTRYARYRRGSIDIGAATNSLQLYFPPEWSPSLPDQQAAVIVRQIAGITQQVAALRDTVANFAVMLGAQTAALRDSIAVVRRVSGMAEASDPVLLARACPPTWRTLGPAGLVANSNTFDTVAAQYTAGGSLNSAWRWFHPVLCSRQ